MHCLESILLAENLSYNLILDTLYLVLETQNFFVNYA